MKIQPINTLSDCLYIGQLHRQNPQALWCFGSWLTIKPRLSDLYSGVFSAAVIPEPSYPHILQISSALFLLQLLPSGGETKTSMFLDCVHIDLQRCALQNGIDINRQLQRKVLNFCPRKRLEVKSLNSK